MLGKLVAQARRLNWDKLAARAGAFASRHQAAGFRILFGAAAAFVVLLIHQGVFSFIAERRQFTVPDMRTALAPKWADSQGEEVIRVEGAGRSLFDRDLVAQVGRTFESCAWIRRVTSVERVFPDQIRVRFEYRRPHVAVRRENGFILVDRDGVRLPGVYANPPTCDRAVQIAGVASHPPEPGKAWEDDSLRAAFAMADFIHENTLLSRVAVREVDVANYAGRQDPRRSEISFVTAPGCAIAWGRPAATSRYGDLTTEEKLENLREVMAAYPDLKGLKRVTIYFRGSRTVEPLDAWARGGGVPRPR